MEWGPLVQESELEVLLEKLDYLARGAELVVFAGTLPRGVADDFYAEAIRTLARRGVLTVLDAEGEPLRVGLEAEPFLVSPNRTEAEAVVGQEFSEDGDFLDALERLEDLGARNALITFERGCFASVRVERGQPKRFRAETPTVEAVSGVGAGAVLLAGFIAAWLENATPEDALRRAVAAGAASTLSVGAGRFDPEDVGRLLRGGPRRRALAPSPAHSAATVHTHLTDQVHTDLELGRIERLLALEAKFAREGLTFDDVLLVPAESHVLPNDVATTTPLHAFGRAADPRRLGGHGHGHGGGDGDRARAHGRHRASSTGTSRSPIRRARSTRSSARSRA